MRTRLATAAALSSCALAAGLLGPAGTPARADEDERRRQIDSSIAQVRADLQDTSKQLSAALTGLRRVEADLARARSTTTAVRRQLDSAAANEGRLAAQLAATQRKVETTTRDHDALAARATATRRTLERVARASYQQGAPNELAVYLRAETPQDLVDRVAYTRSALRSRDALLGQLGTQRSALSERQAELRASQAETVRLRTAAAANVARIQGLQREVLAWQRSATALTIAARGARAALTREQAAEAGRLSAMERELQALQGRLAERERTRGGWTGDGGDTLTRPVAAPVSSTYGMRLHPILRVRKMHDGTDFGARCGTPVYAAASGFVIDSRSTEGYGNRLEIDHGVKRGRSLAATYNHLATRLVPAGAYVYRGQLIATVGDTGLSTACHLHFSVYVDGEHVDPQRWL